MVSNVLVILERAVNRLEVEVVKAEEAMAEEVKVKVPAAKAEEEAKATVTAKATVETREDSVPVLALEEKSF